MPTGKHCRQARKFGLGVVYCKGSLAITISYSVVMLKIPYITLQGRSEALIATGRFLPVAKKSVKINDIIIIKKIKMCKIGHSSALCGRELALRELAHFLTRPVTIATPVNKSTSILAVVPEL